MRKILLFIFLIYQISFSGNTGKITGKVIDEKTGDALPGVNIIIQNTTLGASSDINGKFTILNIPPGNYTLIANFIGYHQVKILNVNISADYTSTINISLKESSIEMGDVVIIGEKPLIRHDQTNPVVAITAEDFQSLPVNTVSEVIGLQAGIVVDDNGAFHVRGGRSNEISFTLNGIALNDPYNNQSSIGVAVNALQEVSVSTGTFSAEYGNALSGIVNYVTKEGSQNFNGSFRTQFGDYISRNNNVFSELNKIDPFNKQRIEVTFGGPLLIDGLKFYTSSVYRNENGYLYGENIYTPNNFYVYASELNWQKIKYDSLGQPLKGSDGNYLYFSDPRLGSITSPFYFDPISNDTTVKKGLPNGNRKIVPLNTFTTFNLQANVSYLINALTKIKYEIIYDNGVSQDAFYYSYRYNPNGRPTNFSNGILHAIDFNQTISDKSFYTIKGSFTNTDDNIYTFKDIDDARYLPSFYQTTLPNTSFLTGGVSLGRTFRNSKSYSLKGDFNSQILDEHEIKVGFEFRKHKMNLETYSLEFYDPNDPQKVITKFQDVYLDSIKYKARVPNVTSGYINYNREPFQFSSYMQDKIELTKSLILNAGLRYEYFDPSAKYNPNLSNALSNRDTIFLIKDLIGAKPKYSLSPRLSMAYPITEQGVVRFSYGHFYQFGNLSSIYTNPNFRAPDGVRPVFGNADVKPQKSVQYEIGLQQALTNDIRLEVVGFFKDIRDYIFRQIVVTSKGDISYEVLTNLDYATSRGLTLSLFKRRVADSPISATLDYTFQIAEGNRTEPREDFFFSEKSNKSAETFLVPLSFDRRHTLNTTLSYSELGNYSVSTIFKLNSGAPYTPSIPASLSLQQTYFVQNSAIKPFQWTTDFKIEKYFKLDNLNCSAILQIDNLFDVKNEIDVYSNSGKALYNANEIANPNEFAQTRNRILRGDDGLIPLSAIDNYYADPQNVSRPRLVRLGFSISF